MLSVSQNFFQLSISCFFKRSVRIMKCIPVIFSLILESVIKILSVIFKVWFQIYFPMKVAPFIEIMWYQIKSSVQLSLFARHSEIQMKTDMPFIWQLTVSSNKITGLSTLSVSGTIWVKSENWKWLFVY